MSNSTQPRTVPTEAAHDRTRRRALPLRMAWDVRTDPDGHVRLSCRWQ